ncbi:MAG: hypothetical protein FJX70_07590 [Alphaproteobacteria bacterium]|nr:hypothetical protein [Alphaproteobacteria bacterium]
MTKPLIIDGKEYVSLKEAAETFNVTPALKANHLKSIKIKNKHYVKKIDVENLATFYKESELLKKELAQKKVLIMAQYETERKLTTNKIESLRKKYLNINPHYERYLIFFNNFKNIIIQKEHNIHGCKNWGHITQYFYHAKISPLSSSETLIITLPPHDLEQVRKKHNQEVEEAILLCNFNVKIYFIQELRMIKNKV